MTDDERKATEDMVMFGTGVLLNGKHIPLKDFQPRSMLTPDQIRYHLPHGDPMVLIDLITQFQPVSKAYNMGFITTETMFGKDHWVFKGHFRKSPLVPGFLSVEAMGQAACLLVNISLNQAGDDAVCYLMSASAIKFRRRVFPGDTLTIQVALKRQRGDIFTFIGVAWVGDEKAIEATFSAKMVVNKPVDNHGKKETGTVAT